MRSLHYRTLSRMLLSNGLPKQNLTIPEQVRCEKRGRQAAQR